MILEEEIGMSKLLSMLLSLLLGLGSYGGVNAPASSPDPSIRAQAPAASSQPSLPPESAPISASKDTILPVDGIDGNTVLTLGDNVYYDFADHGYMSVGLDGTYLPYDVYYGVEMSAEGTTLSVTWHNYTESDVYPTAMTMYSPYLDASVDLGKVTAKAGQTISINAVKSKTGPYELQIAWNTGAITALGFYKNGDEIWSCQDTENSSTYMCCWYDRKDAIDGLLAASGVTPENSLDYSDSRWAYPAPADYGSKYRCDNARWIGLARELTTEEMSDAQKAIVIHDWMVENLAYDQYKVSKLHQTRAAAHKDYSGKYSMWDTKTGVCADFTTVYCIMLRSVGVPAVSLDYNNEHVWNVVYLDGDWVEIDLTDDIDRIVYGEDTTDISNAADTVDYDAFGTPYTIETVTPGKYSINRGVYTYDFVTGCA